MTIIENRSLEVHTYMDEIEWEDMRDIGRYIADVMLDAGKQIAFVAADKIDWLGHGGFKFFKFEDARDQLWQEIAGINGDFTLRNVTAIEAGKQFGFMCSSHDVPTGGLRSVRPMNGKQLYEMYRKQANISRKDLLEEFDCLTYNLGYGDKPTNEQLYEAIEFADTDVLESVLNSARDE